MAFPRWTRYSIWLKRFSTSPSYRGWFGRPLHAAVDQSPESDRSASGSDVASHSSDERKPSPRTDVFEGIASCLQWSFFRLAFYDWQLHCCCIHKQRGSNRTLTIKSHETVVDVVMCVWNTWTGVFFKQESFATWRMCINEVVLLFLMHLHPTSSDKGIEVFVDL